LRESGHIEEHADIVMLIHNPQAGTGTLLTEPVESTLIVAKHRNGPTGAVKMMWNPKVQRFAEVAKDGRL
jgi:replicative DNA helicase